MTALEALRRLRELETPAVATADAAALLRMPIAQASNTLARLAGAGMISRVRHGLWAIRPPIDPLALPEFLTAPQPSYVSLQTALYLHGMVSQIPAVVYAVSLDRTQRIRTTDGVFSIHHVAPEFFGGFDVRPDSTVKLATPEKALLDVLYLSTRRSRLFTTLPELELPARFRVGVARAWVKRIPAKWLRTLVAEKLEELVQGR